MKNAWENYKHPNYQNRECQPVVNARPNRLSHNQKFIHT